MESIPGDILDDILLRQPLKSLLACIFVCKTWKTIICNEDFKTRYLLLSMTRPRLNSTPDSLFHSICRERDQYAVSAPIRGWICVQSSAMLRLYNPITNEIMRLPRLVGYGRRYHPQKCIFGYDEANGVFKVLGIFNSSFIVYTVRSGGEGSWRPVACQHGHMYISPLTRHSVNSFPTLSFTNALCKGGVLYYAAIDQSDFTTTIMSFDLSSEEFTVIPLPEGFIVDNGCTMVNYNGKVALMTNSAAELQDTGGFQICVRDEDSGQWVSERVEIPGWRTTVWSESLFSFVGTTGSDGELVFTTVARLLTEPEYVLYYKPGTGATETLTLVGENKCAYQYVRACLNHFECLFRTT